MATSQRASRKRHPRLGLEGEGEVETESESESESESERDKEGEGASLPPSPAIMNAFDAMKCEPFGEPAFQNLWSEECSIPGAGGFSDAMERCIRRSKTPEDRCSWPVLRDEKRN